MKQFTSQWRAISISITEYLVNLENRKNLSVTELYNNWAKQSSITIQENEMFNWALNFISEMKSVDTTILREAIQLDTQLERTGNASY